MGTPLRPASRLARGRGGGFGKAGLRREGRVAQGGSAVALFAILPTSAGLGWSHFRLLLRVSSKGARTFYVEQAGVHGWSVRQLEMHVQEGLFERVTGAGGELAARYGGQGPGVGAGETLEEIIEAYPQLTGDAIHGALASAAEVLSGKRPKWSTAGGRTRRGGLSGVKYSFSPRCLTKGCYHAGHRIGTHGSWSSRSRVGGTQYRVERWITGSDGPQQVIHTHRQGPHT